MSPAEIFLHIMSVCLLLWLGFSAKDENIFNFLLIAHLKGLFTYSVCLRWDYCKLYTVLVCSTVIQDRWKKWYIMMMMNFMKFLPEGNPIHHSNPTCMHSKEENDLSILQLAIDSPLAIIIILIMVIIFIIIRCKYTCPLILLYMMPPLSFLACSKTASHTLFLYTLVS